MILNNKLNMLAGIYLAKAIKDLHPEVTLGSLTTNEDGFLYTFKTDEALSTTEFNKIKKQIQKNIDRNYAISYEKQTSEQLHQLFQNQEYKKELIEGDAYICKLGDDFADLCNEDLGIFKSSQIKALELFNVSGVYWKGDAKNTQLTGISGAAFESADELEQFKFELQERRERDHRKIGTDLELFAFNNLVGQGLPIWLPNGTAIKHEIETFIHDLLQFNEYNFVQTPVLGSIDLYKTSGHWDHYRENMFAPIKIENEIVVLRPMTCPHHLVVYKLKPRSYNDLPFRLAEHGILHRYEPSGSLIGLERVRSMQLVDTHVICMQSQIRDEINHAYKVVKASHEGLGTKITKVELALHDRNDKEKFFDNEEMWLSAEHQLREAVKDLGLPCVEMVGEAAFYGPKIDFQVETSLKKTITVSTIQLDFLLPERFELEYKSNEGKMERPVLIHAGIIGTFERFMSILLEQTKGVLPLWLSPVQVTIIPVMEEKHTKYCKEIFNFLKENRIRTNLNTSDERLGKKIRDAQMKKIPYQVVIGDTEIENKNISYREYGKQDAITLSVSEFVEMLKNRIKMKN